MSHYKVGYKKPPKEHRFKKGRSGNPNGRPKKKKKKMPEPADNSMPSILKRVGEKVVEISGESRTLNEVAVLALYKKAMEGNVAAIRQLAGLWKQAALQDDSKSQPFGGVLVVPGPMDEADFEKLAFKQQAPFRERTTDYDEKGKKEPNDDLG